MQSPFYGRDTKQQKNRLHCSQYEAEISSISCCNCTDLFSDGGSPTCSTVNMESAIVHDILRDSGIYSDTLVGTMGNMAVVSSRTEPCCEIDRRS